MTRFYGKVGYADPVETSPGVHEEVITEKSYFGEVTRADRTLDGGDSVNPKITVGNAISVVADAFAEEHFQDIRYVEWAGNLWTVTSVEVQRPRLLLTLGEQYHGPTPE
jgi:hypothetical protein